MKLTVDSDTRTAEVEIDGEIYRSPLYSRRAFRWISQFWIRVGWHQKYTYSFSWLGRPIIQLPEDLMRIQEVIYRVEPDVIIETGVAHGGSLVYYASLCKAMGRGRVIGVDIDIRLKNRLAIAGHELAHLISLVEGNSVAPKTVAEVESLITTGERGLVILDSLHTREHVTRELEAYAKFVAPGSYIVVQDGLIQYLTDVPRGKAKWSWDNPGMAAKEFALAHPEFALERPLWTFNESRLNPFSNAVTHWPGGWLRRL